MKVRHRGSGEEFDLREPVYTKLNGMYGYLTHNCYFIAALEDTVDGIPVFSLDNTRVIDDFEIIEN